MTNRITGGFNLPTHWTQSFSVPGLWEESLQVLLEDGTGVSLGTLQVGEDRNVRKRLRLVLPGAPHSAGRGYIGWV